MCTVTFVPVKNGIVLTSSRDEWKTRGRAISPTIVTVAPGVQVISPTDKDKGGSWIAGKSNGDMGVLLNGAFKPHHRLQRYKRSRGQVMMDIMHATSPLDQWKEISLQGIEPFTLVLFAGGRLYECRWDGHNRHCSILPSTERHIWSSVTLYDEKMSRLREKWFGDWQYNSGGPDQQQILKFHREAGNGDARYSLVMDRGGDISTSSITSVFVSGETMQMKYFDLQSERESVSELSPSVSEVSLNASGLFSGKTPSPDVSTPASALADRYRRCRIRLMSWEYWPFDLVYVPIYLYWMWLSLKARSFFYFSAANPLIKNSGFVMESKMEIYELMPQSVYPRTIFCEHGVSMVDVEGRLRVANLNLPLIAKPDIGQRGLMVKLCRSEAELADYVTSTGFDFLLQEFVPFENEVGIFYYRIPGEQTGTISGMVGKEFLAVTGDGVSTVEQLMRGSDRAFLQLPVFRKTHAVMLQSVPARGEMCELVPYGNHSRGAKFLDLTQLVTPDLGRMIDQLCTSIPEFYYGRLDIRYENWDRFCAGKDFAIIEVNGAGSEPTHIYDPRHSVFFAWKEIIRHLKIMFTISRINSRTKGIRLMGTGKGLSMLRENRRYLKLLADNAAAKKPQ
ncbi:MAG: hypothetical protein EOO05_07350 [Chitinophagaceae bacterium]|nr:MAG: hypothetical protein EOO05_07350 [Chitinophagaceae bacterium]